MISNTNFNVGLIKFKTAISAQIVTTATSATRTGGGCHSRPNLSKTGLSANLKNARFGPLKAPLLKYGARRGKKLGSQSGAKAMNPPRRKRFATSGRDTPNTGFTFVRKDS